ncbi:MAG TPA: TIGR03621 family F420-dependent LLM class oxidoreductase [Ktedonobacteraceae bacterium]
MASTRPFRFSLLVNRAKSRQEWITKARRAEELGYTTLLTADHLYQEVDPIASLMTVADATSLRIGSHVFCNDFRHPIVLARQVANLDLFSEGRVQLGLGCGYFAEEYAQAGIPMDSPAVRVSRFAEALQLIKAYFHEDEVTFSGEYYQVKGLKTAAKSQQRPHPPIYIGGGGKRVLSIAAREADIVGLVAKNNEHGLEWTNALSDANAQKIEWIRQAAGERFSQIELSSTVFIAAVTDQSQGAAQQIGKRLGLSAEQTIDCFHMLIGSVDQIVEELYRRRELFGVSSIEIGESHMETLAPVVARLTGQ